MRTKSSPISQFGRCHSPVVTVGHYQWDHVEGGMVQRSARRLVREYGLQDVPKETRQDVVRRHHWIRRLRLRQEVDRVWAEAAARGVQVVVDETLPHSFVLVEVADEDQT
jgi:predicted metallo-beta-lactamase superfamily hydrolase